MISLTATVVIVLSLHGLVIQFLLYGYAPTVEKFVN